MNLAHALRLFPTPHLPRQSIAFVGAGGKTTAMIQLARQLSPPVLVTTTTHLGAWQSSFADQHLIAESARQLNNLDLRGITLITGVLDSDRFERVNEDTLLWLHDVSRRKGIPLLIEADGARQKPLKAPAAHEPSIPEFVDSVVVVAGLSAVNQPISADRFF